MAASQTRGLSLSPTGTREWAVATANCCLGCAHNCRYCYARWEAVHKRQDLTAEQWPDAVIQWDKVHRPYALYAGGRVMFPSEHDILPDNLEACSIVIKKLLAAGNQLLVVSKPHLTCIRHLCEHFVADQDRILFRFTIGSHNDAILSCWEPGAPLFKERLAALRWAFDAGFATSVSIEPMLDVPNVLDLVNTLLAYVTDSIWLGKMNKIRTRVVIDTAEMRREVDRLERQQGDEQLRELYLQLHNTPQIRWKDSIKRLVGLPQPSAPGLDI